MSKKINNLVFTHLTTDLQAKIECQGILAFIYANKYNSFSMFIILAISSKMWLTPVLLSLTLVPCNIYDPINIL